MSFGSSLFRVIGFLLLSPCSSGSVPGVHKRVQTSWTPYRGGPCRGAQPSAEEPRPEATRPLLQGANLRTGAALPAAALPLCTGEGTSGWAHPSHPEPGEDLVPEPPLQDEAGPRGAEPGRASAATAPPRRHPDPGAGGEAV